ncbi:MAG: DUF4783 domain-containing protein [Cyclobacteriaceae bacterium]|jgi:hypothetical protein
MKPLISFSFVFLFTFSVKAQEDVISNIGAALKTSSAKELIKYCNSSVEIQENGVSNTYNRPQAEIILKTFFDQHPATDFRYIHQGASPEGYKYTIAQYTAQGEDYRVYYLLKKGGDTYTIHTISFSKE